MPDTQLCPACDSPNLWEQDFTEDGYPHAIYRHCYSCGFCWDSRMDDKPDYLAIEAGEYSNIHRDWEETRA